MNASSPLAERLRPNSLEQFVGQQHLVGKGATLHKAIEAGNLPSILLWGPPGTGKTTLARIISNQLKRPFYTLSAINSGVKDVREAIVKAEKQQFFNTPSPILFIDEIHRFSKSQQDSLLSAVEKGTIVLIGATTENPSFEVIPALLSRCQVYILQPLKKEELLTIAKHAIQNDIYLKSKEITIEEDEALIRFSGGDARKLLNCIEIVVNAIPDKKIIINNDIVLKTIQQNIALYDKSGEQHYDIISAFIKSIRGSDPNAAVYWLARMIQGGEDPKFIARRLLILASEDIGNANPTALVLANSCFQAVNVIGYPECELILSQTTIYLAASPKSNASYVAILQAKGKTKETGDLSVPLHIRNAPTQLMKEIGYGKDYKYAHQYDDNFIEQEFLPKDISGTTFYNPGNNPREEEIRKQLKKLWKKKYNY